jgi:hypothetical protein
VSDLSSVIYKSNTILSNVSASYFIDINKPNLKIVWKSKQTELINTIVKKINKLEGLIVAEFQDL